MGKDSTRKTFTVVSFETMTTFVCLHSHYAELKIDVDRKKIAVSRIKLARLLSKPCLLD